ncbi:MAG: HAD family hydrolase [Flavobacterium sp.]|nr:MAG: HAD family hydrolase [Flavobacterium sp.]
MNIDFDTYFFDCDGVILDSNKIKSEGFFKIALNYTDDEGARQFLEYHKSNGGISRQEKFKYFQSGILEKPYSEGLQRELVNLYGTWCQNELLDAPVTEGFYEFIESVKPSSRKFVVSGGSENELHELFQKRNLSRYFEQIRGNPTSKDDIMRELFENNSHFGKNCFIGDSIYDYQCSKKYVNEFIFIYKYSECRTYDNFFKGLPKVTLEKTFTTLLRKAAHLPKI